MFPRVLNGAAGVNRTRDPFLTKEVLYHWATAAAQAERYKNYFPRASKKIILLMNFF